MSYGSDVTEGLPLNLSNPATAVTYSGGNESYDLSVNSQPFFLMTNDEFPYRRETAQYRKQQIDQSSEPGEQSITGWWVRAQSSFHKGAGIKYYDPSAGETVSYRFADCRGVNVWNKGQVTLLNRVDSFHVTTASLNTNRTVAQHLRSIKWDNGTSIVDGVLLHDGYDVDKITAGGGYTQLDHFIDYNSGADWPVYAICDDGQYAYWVTNRPGTPVRMYMYKKLLTGDSTTSDTTMFYDAGTLVTHAVMEYVKERIILCVNNKVYEIPTNATALTGAGGGNLVYTHPNPNYVFTSISASGSAIYISGYNGIQSTISKFTLTSTDGTMPVLTSAITAAEMPVGEIVHKIYYYTGVLAIGTSKGIRIASVSDQDGSLGYGPLIVETNQPCYDFAARSNFIWCATGHQISSTEQPRLGTIRIDLNSEIEALRFAYANDLSATESAGYHSTTAVAFIGDTNLQAFTSDNAYGSNGTVYIESANDPVAEGYIQTGFIRYATLENKVFKTIKARINNTYGSLKIESIDYTNTAYTIGNFNEGALTPEVGVNYPIGAQEYLAFKFTLSRSTITTTQGPILTGYQLKSLPAIPKQRLIQYPLACYDREMDSFGNQVGYENAAYEKLLVLESLENDGDTIRIEDFRTGEIYNGIIESMQFLNRTPSDKRFSGFGGILLVTIRTV